MITVKVRGDHMGKFSAGDTGIISGYLWSVIGTICTGNRIVTNMSGLDDNKIIPMVRMRPMSVNCQHATNPTMIEGKCPKMLGEKNDGQALIFIGTKSPGRHDVALVEP